MRDVIALPSNVIGRCYFGSCGCLRLQPTTHVRDSRAVTAHGRINMEGSPRDRNDRLELTLIMVSMELEGIQLVDR